MPLSPGSVAEPLTCANGRRTSSHDVDERRPRGPARRPPRRPARSVGRGEVGTRWETKPLTCPTTLNAEEARRVRHRSPMRPPTSGFTVDQLNLVAAARRRSSCWSPSLAVRLSERSGLPTLLLYLGLGRGDRRGRAAALQFDDPGLTQVLGYVALVVILAEGGLTTSWSSIRAGGRPGGRAGHRRRRRLGRRRRRRRAPDPRRDLAGRPAGRRRPDLDRRRRGVLGAAPGPAAAPADRRRSRPSPASTTPRS